MWKGRKSENIPEGKGEGRFGKQFKEGSANLVEDWKIQRHSDLLCDQFVKKQRTTNRICLLMVIANKMQKYIKRIGQ